MYSAYQTDAYIIFRNVALRYLHCYGHHDDSRLCITTEFVIYLGLYYDVTVVYPLETCGTILESVKAFCKLIMFEAIVSCGGFCS